MEDNKYREMVTNLLMASLQIQQEMLSELNQMKSQLISINVNTDPGEPDPDAEPDPFQTLNGPRL